MLVFQLSHRSKVSIFKNVKSKEKNKLTYNIKEYLVVHTYTVGPQSIVLEGSKIHITIHNGN